MAWTDRIQPIQVGDQVAYSKRFLQSIGAYTGDMPQAKGKVTALKPIGKDVTLSESVGGATLVRGQALRRVLGNLIDNAVKYGGSAEVSARRNQEGALCITVCDRGPGIPEDQLEHVLQPFYRVEGSRNRDTGGAGLGLAIATQLTRAIGGSLQLSNRHGGGLAAIVTLP